MEREETEFDVFPDVCRPSLAGELVIPNTLSKLLKHPKLETNTQVEVVPEVSEEVAGANIVRGVEIPAPLDEVVSKRTRNTFAMDNAGVLREPDR